MVQKSFVTIQEPSDESLRITTKRPTGRHGKLEESSWMHWCTEQMIAGYKRNPAEEPTDQNRGNLLGEPRETYENRRASHEVNQGTASGHRMGTTVFYYGNICDALGITDD